MLFFYNKYGKPFLKEYPNYHFNLSHSEEWVVCGTDYNRLGIDIEKVREIDLEIAEHFFTPFEWQEIKSKSKETQLIYFYRIWTMKESYIKAIGKGLTIPLNSFSIIGENKYNKEVFFKEGTYYFEEIIIEEGYTLTVCSKNPKCKLI